MFDAANPITPNPHREGEEPAYRTQGADENTDESIRALVTTMASSLNLKNAIKGLKTFNGYNRPLKDFLVDVRNGAAQLSESQQDTYIKNVLGCLEGEARDCIYGYAFEDVESLVKHLKERFAPGKDYSYYSEKIHNITMKKGESVGMFYDRLNILLMGARGALRQPGVTSQQIIERIKPLEEVALLMFKKGLPAEIATTVHSQRPANLNEAYQAAVELENLIKRHILPDAKPRHRQIEGDEEEDEFSNAIKHRNDRSYPEGRGSINYRPNDREYSRKNVRVIAKEIPSPGAWTNRTNGYNTNRQYGPTQYHDQMDYSRQGHYRPMYHFPSRGNYERPNGPLEQYQRTNRNGYYAQYNNDSRLYNPMRENSRTGYANHQPNYNNNDYVRNDFRVRNNYGGPWNQNPAGQAWPNESWRRSANNPTQETRPTDSNLNSIGARHDIPLTSPYNTESTLYARRQEPPITRDESRGQILLVQNKIQRPLGELVRVQDLEKKIQGMTNPQ